MAFAIASGVAPEQGPGHRSHHRLHHFGGRRHAPLCIGGPTGAFIVVLYGILIPLRLGKPDDLHDDGGRHPDGDGCGQTGAADPLCPQFGDHWLHQWHCGADRAVTGEGLSRSANCKMPGEFFGIVKALWAALPNLHGPSMLLAIACLAFLRMWPAKWSRYIPSPFLV